MENKKRAKIFSLIPIILWGIMVLDVIMIYIWGELPRSDHFIKVGIGMAFFFLIMCVVAPIVGLICGIMGVICARKVSKSKNAWLVLSVVDIVISTLGAFQCLIWLLAACSGQI